jgi:hypothetical protein
VNRDVAPTGHCALLPGLHLCSITPRRSESTRRTTALSFSGNWRAYPLPELRATNAATPGIYEFIAFICSHCGQSVSVEPPKIH